LPKARQRDYVPYYQYSTGHDVEVTFKGEKVRGWIGGYTDTPKTKNISIYDHDWSRKGQFNPNNVRLLQRSSNMCIFRDPKKERKPVLKKDYLQLSLL